MTESANYAAYLQSTTWKNKRREYQRNRRWQCNFCGFKRGINLHHVSYAHVGDEPLDDLIPLCAQCHLLVHEWMKAKKCTVGVATADVRTLVRQRRAGLRSQRQVKNLRRSTMRAARWAEFHPRGLADRMGLPPGETKLRYK